MNANEFVEYIKSNYPPSYWDGKDEEFIYRLGRKLEPGMQVDALPVSRRTYTPDIQTSPGITRPRGPYDIDFSPERFKALETMELTKQISENQYYEEQRTLETSPTGKPKDEGGLLDYTAFGDWGLVDENSSNFMKLAYNQSLTGAAYTLTHGEEQFKYDVENYEPTWWEEVAASVVSFIFPLDVLAMGTGVGIGGKLATKVGTKTVSKAAVKNINRNLIQRGIENRFGASYIHRNLVKKVTPAFTNKFRKDVGKAAVEQGSKQAFGMGVYEGARGNIQAQLEGKEGWDLFEATVGSFTHGMVLGGVSGYGGGMLGAKWNGVGKVLKDKKARGIKPSKNLLKLFDKSKEGVSPFMSRQSFEVGVFTVPSVYDEFKALSEGQEFNINNIFRSALVNVGQIGVMHSIGNTLSRSVETLEAWGEKNRIKIAEGFSQDSSLNAIEKKLKQEIAESSGSHKEALESVLNDIVTEKSNKTKKIEGTAGRVSELISQVRAAQQKLKDFSKDKPKTTKQINDASGAIANGINLINQIIGETNNKELIGMMESFNINFMKTLKNNIGTTVRTKPQLMSLYKKLRKSTKKDTDFIQVERNGRIVKKNLKKNAKEITKDDLTKAIENEADGLNHGAAEQSIKSIEKNNMVEDYNTSENFRRGHSVDQDGNRRLKPYQEKTNQKHGRHKNRFIKKNGRDKDVQDRAERLEQTHKDLKNDAGDSKMSYDMRNVYAQSKSILLNAIETIFLDKVVNKGGKNQYKSISSVKSSVDSINRFSKWLAGKYKKNLHEVSNKHIKEYLTDFGTSQDGLIFKEFFTDIQSKVRGLDGKKTRLSYDMFYKYGDTNPVNNKPASPFEIEGRINERRLKVEFDFTDEQVRDLRQDVVGVRKYKDMTTKQQIVFERHIRTLLSKDYGGRTNSIRGAEIRLKLRATELGFGDKIVKKTLKAFGVRGGNFKNVKNPETLKQVESFLTDGLHQESSPTMYDKIRLLEQKDAPFDMKEMPHGVVSKIFKGVMPTWYRMREFISEKLSNTFLDSELDMSNIYGETQRKISKINQILGDKKDRNMLRFIDKARRKEAVTAREKRFIKKLNDSGTIRVDGKVVKLKAGETVPWDAVLEGGSKEWRAAMIDKQMKDRLWDTFKSAVKRNATPQQYKNFVRKFDKKYIDHYHSRVVNPEVLRYLFKDGEPTGSYKKLIAKELRKDAVIKAANKNLKPGTKPYKQFIKNYIDKNKEKKELDFTSYFYEKPVKLSTGFLMDRGPILGDKNGMIEVSTKLGKKKIKVYIDDYSQITDSYTNSMSKMIVASRHFPEWVEFTELGGNNIQGIIPRFDRKVQGKTVVRGIESLKRKIGESGQEWTYALTAIENHLGINKEHFNKLHSTKNRVLKTIGNAVVVFGLSMPIWHGVKNFGIGQARNIGAFGAYNTMKGLLATFDRQNWRAARGKGYLDQGRRSLETSQSRLKKAGFEDLSIENMFKYWNLMQPFESINRISSSVAGLHYFENSLRNYKGKRTVLRKWGHKEKMQFEDMLRDRLHFNDREIKYLRETSFDDLFAADNPAMAYISEKAGHHMHMSTQGGTGVPQLPLWASKPHLKPLTIFYRIAGHATFDTYINFIKPAVKYQNAFPLLRMAIGHSVSGMALYWLYEQAFDQPSPFDSIDASMISDDQKKELELRKIFFNLHQSGMFGLAEPFFHPTTGILSGNPLSTTFSPKNSFTNMPVTMPAVIDMGINLKNNVLQFLFEKPFDKGYTEWGIDRTLNFLKQSSSLGGAVQKMITKENSAFMKNRKDVRAQFRQYVASIGKSAPMGDWDSNPVLENLKVKLTRDDATYEDKIKAVMLTYNFYVHEILQSQTGKNPLEAHKGAIQAIERSLLGLKIVGTHLGDGLDDEDIVNFYNTRTTEWQNIIYSYDAMYNQIVNDVKGILDEKNNFRKYSILGHVENMKNVNYVPKNYGNDFYESLDDDEKEAYKSYRLFY